MDRKLPVYKLVIPDELENGGVNFVALVDSPAIIAKAFLFKNHQKFSVNKERQIITTPAMIADLPIYRRDEERGEYYVVFDKLQIEKIQHKFMKSGFLHNVNEMHDPNKKVDGVYMINSFLSDKQMGINPPEMFADLPEGSWFISYKIENADMWKKFSETQEFTGVSVEGIFDMAGGKPVFEKAINDKINDILMSTQTGKIKSIVEACKNFLSAAVPQKFADAKLMDGVTIVRFPNETLVKGDAIMVITEEGELPLPDSPPDTPY
ncbi:MAG TPA: XkdF-like putative serine protease domain-containing protein, partial [Flavisolibacter sp.]